MDINWGGLVGITLAICVCICPFTYVDRRAKGGTQFRAALDVLLVSVIVFLWVTGGSSLLYGLGIIVDRPAEQLGSGGFLSAEIHMEEGRVAYFLLGIGLTIVAYAIGKVSKLNK